MDFLDPIQQIYERIPVFLLVVFRVGGMMALSPLLGLDSIPMRVKAMTAFVLAAAVFPLVPPAAGVPDSWSGLALAVGGEMLIGLLMGFTITLILAGIQIGAQTIAHQMGWGLAQVVDPTATMNIDVLTQFYTLLATLIFVLMKGLLILIRSLAETFRSIPLLTAWSVNPDMVGTLTGILQNSFALSIRIAGPALAAVFLATLALGFISRTMPQLNILAAGFPVQITLVMIILVASTATVLWLFQDSLAYALGEIETLFL